jgi:hypothetical protein
MLPLLLAPKKDVLDGNNNIIRAAFGEDVVLSDVLAFDVRAFDPGAQIRSHWGADGQWTPVGSSDDLALVPGDPAYYLPNQPLSTQHVGYGAYVDLGYWFPPSFLADAALTFRSQFSGPPDLRSQLIMPTWDTWPFDYERDGFNQGTWLRNAQGGLEPVPNSTLIDEGTNGFDNTFVTPSNQQVLQNVLGGIDDADERETAPPYNAPLRGIQIKLRALEPDSRQFLQTTVSAEFAPE